MTLLTLPPMLDGIARTVADPLYGAIHLTATESALLDSPAMQRLTRVRQLNVATVAYPGATHTRFEHCAGVGHLAKQAIALLPHTSDADALPTEEEALEFVLAALLHDIGHSGGIGSHLLEELGYDWADHEHLALRRLREEPIAEILATIWSDGSGPSRLGALISGEATSHPLQSLLSSALDVDKLDYLVRDSRECGVPYGQIDALRLLQHCTLLRTSQGERLMALHESALPSLEHFLTGRRLMYQTVYFHKSVRAATSMNQRLGWLLLRHRLMSPVQMTQSTDDEYVGAVAVALAKAETNPPVGSPQQAELAEARALSQRLLDRQLYKVAATASGDMTTLGDDVDTETLMTAASAISRELTGKTGQCLVDIPRKANLFPLDAWILSKQGQVRPLASLGEEFPLAGIRPQLEASTSRVRLFSATAMSAQATDGWLRALLTAIPALETLTWEIETDSRDRV